MSPPRSGAEITKPRDIRAFVRPRAQLLAVLVALATVMGRLGALWWVFDLASHFAVQLVCAGLFTFGLALWARDVLAAIVAASGLIVNAALVVPLYLDADTASQTGWSEAAVKVTAINVNSENPHKEAVVRFIEDAGHDLVFVFEVSPAWLEALRQTPAHRVVVAEPRTDSFGIALLARSDAVTGKLLYTSDGIGFIDARYQRGDVAWAVLGVHPVPPVGGNMTAQRNAALDFIADWAAGQSGPAVVIGDLNTTPFSPSLSRLLARGRLVSSQPGFGLQTTWPQYPWFLVPGKIPIDHALHNRAVVTCGRSVGPALGSDHRPLSVCFGLAD